jgi:hypothetical protein
VISAVIVFEFGEGGVPKQKATAKCSCHSQKLQPLAPCSVDDQKSETSESRRDAKMRKNDEQNRKAHRVGAPVQASPLVFSCSTNNIKCAQ